MMDPEEEHLAHIWFVAGFFASDAEANGELLSVPQVEASNEFDEYLKRYREGRCLGCGKLYTLLGNGYCGRCSPPTRDTNSKQ